MHLKTDGLVLWSDTTTPLLIVPSSAHTSVFQCAILNDGLIRATLRFMSEMFALPLTRSPQARYVE